MKIHTCFITYNRLELTKRAIHTYLETVSAPWTAVVVDNNSTDGTFEWLWSDPIFRKGPQLRAVTLPDNFYPGRACNIGWQLAPEDADFLHRADNDFIFLKDWCSEVEERFQDAELGQLGLRTNDEELWNPHNVGGNCIVRRQLWDEGLRWDERKWTQIKAAGYTEDSYFSPAVERMGWKWGRVEKRCIVPISREDPNDPYYIATWADRGIIK